MIIKIGTQKVSKNFVSNVKPIFLYDKMRKAKRMGPSINSWTTINSKPRTKLISILFSDALSEVWARVTQPFWIFHTIFGNTIMIAANRQTTTEIILAKKTFFNWGSIKKINIIDKTKYIAAYFDKKDKPINIPRRIKFIFDGLPLIFNRNKREKDQKNTSTMSVEIKKEETDAAGIR